MTDSITPFMLSIPDSELELLRRRLGETRWPNAETADGWVQGVPLACAKALVEYWRTAYDWRRCESKLNGFGQFRTTIDGLGIHFLHVRSKHPDALPLLMTHGWPGSVIEFHKVIGPLSDPTAHGGKASNAFHVVAPSLPGYGFSDKPARKGWNVDRIADAWITLMRRLGYQRYVAQGGDWGSVITTTIAQKRPAELAGIHVNLIAAPPQPLSDPPTPEEQDAVAAGQLYQTAENGYALAQATKPQTLGYGLADSPAGQAMWIYEKFQSWTDCGGDPESLLTRDEILDNIMLYWLTNSGASSARLYWESFASQVGRLSAGVDVPSGFSLFPKELVRPPRAWVERVFSNIIHWNKLPRGGHFAAFEQPEIFVDEVRACFRSLR
ncbi:MAG: epoxide hydrolase [Rhodospirillaceae bacterium]|nr:epoxide hydrolase [Rhodospirillaceae bacterium]